MPQRQGPVSDATGAVIVEANIELRDEAKGVVQSSKTAAITKKPNAI